MLRLKDVKIDLHLIFNIAGNFSRVYLGEKPMRTSLVKSSGRRMEARMPIVPEME